MHNRSWPSLLLIFILLHIVAVCVSKPLLKGRAHTYSYTHQIQELSIFNLKWHIHAIFSFTPLDFKSCNTFIRAIKHTQTGTHTHTYTSPHYIIIMELTLFYMYHIVTINEYMLSSHDLPNIIIMHISTAVMTSALNPMESMKSLWLQVCVLSASPQSHTCMVRVFVIVFMGFHCQQLGWICRKQALLEG